MIIFFEVSLVLIVLSLISVPILAWIFVDYVIGQLVYFFIGIIMFMSFVSIILFISKCKKSNNRFAYRYGIFFALLYIPYIFLITETISLDKCNYFFNQNHLNLELKLMIGICLSCLIFVIPLFITLVSKSSINKKMPSYILCIILILFYIYCATTCTNSYKNYENNIIGDYQNNSAFVINSKAKIYCQSESPKFVYPLISPIKWSIGEFDKGEKVYLVSREELFDYFDYVEVTDGEQTGYVKKNLLTRSDTENNNLNNHELENNKNYQIPNDALVYNEHSYYIYDSIYETWEEAEMYCESLGGHLAVINDENENIALYNYMKDKNFENCYFGYCRSYDNENEWVWVCGLESDFTNWSDGEPNNERGVEKYAEFYWKSPAYEWNDGDFVHGTNNDKATFICEWEYTR